MTEVGQGSDNGPTNTNASEQPSNYLICDRTGFKIPVDQWLHKEWYGPMVRKRSHENMHPQELVRSKAEQDVKGSSRPEPAELTIAQEYPNGVTRDDL